MRGLGTGRGGDGVMRCRSNNPTQAKERTYADGMARKGGGGGWSERAEGMRGR
jgi:hypothetical protein